MMEMCLGYRSATRLLLLLSCKCPVVITIVERRNMITIILVKALIMIPFLNVCILL